jgi:predicted Zn-dependent peptidase
MHSLAFDECAQVLADDMGRQLLAYGRIASAQELCDKIDTVTKEDIIELVNEMLSSPPTVLVYGLPTYFKKLPSYDEIVSSLKR